MISEARKKQLDNIEQKIAKLENDLNEICGINEMKREVAKWNRKSLI